VGHGGRVVSLRCRGCVWRRAIAGSPRRAACRGGRGCCRGLLLIVLLAMRRLRCHGGHDVQARRGERGWCGSRRDARCGRTSAGRARCVDIRYAGGAGRSNGRARGTRAGACLVPADSRTRCRLRAGRSAAATGR
jgi:hypothetical protein